METKTMLRKFPMMLLALVAAFALAALVGCSSTPSNLEEYFAAHPDEWTEFETSFTEASQGEGVLDATAAVAGNEITMSAKYDIDLGDLDAETIASFREMLAPYFSGLSTYVADIEQETGFEGVTLKIVTTDANGSELASFVYDANGEVGAPAAADTAAPADDAAADEAAEEEQEAA